MDPDNNTWPHKRMSDLTGYKKQKTLFNFRLSHIWEKSLNPYAFNAPWNMAYTSIFIDPLTGHETSGDLRNSVKRLMTEKAKKIYGREIQEFNELMLKNEKEIEEFIYRRITEDYSISSRRIVTLQKSLKKSFSSVPID